MGCLLDMGEANFKWSRALIKPTICSFSCLDELVVIRVKTNYEKKNLGLIKGSTILRFVEGKAFSLIWSQR